MSSAIEPGDDVRPIEVPSSTTNGAGLASFSDVRRALDDDDQAGDDGHSSGPLAHTTNEHHDYHYDLPNAWANTSSLPSATDKPVAPTPFLGDLDPFAPTNPFEDSVSLGSGSQRPTPLSVRSPPGLYAAEVHTLGSVVAPGSRLELISDSEGDPSPEPSPTRDSYDSPFPAFQIPASTPISAPTEPAPLTPKGKATLGGGGNTTPSGFFGGMLRSISGSGPASGSGLGSGSRSATPSASTAAAATAATATATAQGESYRKQDEVHDEKAEIKVDQNKPVPPAPPAPPPASSRTAASGPSSSSTPPTPPGVPTSTPSAIAKPLASIASVFRSSSRPGSSSGTPQSTSPPKERSGFSASAEGSKKQLEKAPAAPAQPVPEPQFDFNKFLEQMRSRSADPVAKYLRSFLKEFSRKPPVAANDQVRVINDFLDFIAVKMRLVDPWKRLFVELDMDRAEAEFDMAMEAMEKLVMNRLWHLTFTPAIDLSALPGEMSPTGDIERDHVLSQRIRLFAWVKPIHLDLPLPDPEQLSPAPSRPTSPLPPLDLLTDDEKAAVAPSEDEAQKREKDRQAQGFIDFARRELCKINSYKAPRDKLICLLNACKIIFGLIRQVGKDEGADSFIPFLIYVVLKANPEHLVSNIQYIQRFRNPDKLTGEGGYYLSSLNGAISFIEHMDASSLSNMTQAEFERNVEQAVLSFPADREELSTRSRRVPTSTTPLSPPPPPTGSSTRHRSPLPPPRPSSRPSEAPGPGTLDHDSASVLPGPSPNALESTRNFLVRSSDSVERIVSKPLGAIGRIFDQLEQVAAMAPGPGSGQAGGPPPLPLPPRSSSPTPSTRSVGRRGYARTRGGSIGPTAAGGGGVDPALFAAEGVPNEEVTREIDRQTEERRLAALETLKNVFPNVEQEVLEVVLLSNNNDVGLTIDALLEMS